MNLLEFFIMIILIAMILCNLYLLIYFIYKEINTIKLARIRNLKRKPVAQCYCNDCIYYIKKELKCTHPHFNKDYHIDYTQFCSFGKRSSDSFEKEKLRWQPEVNLTARAAIKSNPENME